MQYCEVWRTIKTWWQARKLALESNKDIFETLAALSLSGMALMVAWQANSIARQQSRLIEQQTAIMESESRLIKQQTAIMESEIAPLFVFQEEFYGTPMLNFEFELAIKNNGGPVYNLSVDVVTFLDVGHMSTAPGTYKIDTPYARLHLIDYYVDHAVLNNSKGFVARLWGESGARNIDELNFDYGTYVESQLEKFQGYLNDPALDFFNLGVTTYVKLKYLDALTKSQTRYYEVLPVSGAILLDPAEGRKIFERDVREAKSISAIGIGPEELYQSLRFY